MYTNKEIRCEFPLSQCPFPWSYPIIVASLSLWASRLWKGDSLIRTSILFPINKRTWLHQSPSWQTPPKRAYNQRTPECIVHLVHSNSPLQKDSSSLVNYPPFSASPVNDLHRIAELVCQSISMVPGRLY